MWTVLYLTPQPLSAQELGETLTMSAGAVSMTLQELTKWGVVKKAWRPGERRDYYEPERSIWKMVSRVFRERELQQVRAIIETFEEALSEVAKALGAHPEESARLKFVTERLESLVNLARVGEKILRAILDGDLIGPTPIKNFFEGNS